MGYPGFEPGHQSLAGERPDHQLYTCLKYINTLILLKAWEKFTYIINLVPIAECLNRWDLIILKDFITNMTLYRICLYALHNKITFFNLCEIVLRK